MPGGCCGLTGRDAAGQGSGARFAPAALAADRSWALVYYPRADALSIDLARLAGPAVRIRWFDPSAGTYLVVNGSPFPNSGVRPLRPPARNASGYSDWLLMLEATSAARNDAGG